MAVRSPTLHAAVRRFCFAAFAWLYREAERGAPVPFAFEEHAAPGRPVLYEYRPLVRGYVEARADQLLRLDDARMAVEELEREPSAALFARAHGLGDEEEPLYRTVLLPLLSSLAEACGGFEWDDGVFHRAYADLERSLFGARHTYGAAAPLLGVACPVAIDLGRGLRVRPAAAGELSAYWPQAQGLLPARFGREPGRTCIVELERSLPAGEAGIPDGPGEVAEAVTALRLAAAAPAAAGPVVFERLDWRPYGVRPMPSLAATEPAGEATRLDEFRGRLARDLLHRLRGCDADPDLDEAVDRWERALVAPEPLRSQLLGESLTSLLAAGDGGWAAAARAAVLVGEGPQDRAELFSRLRRLAAGRPSQAGDADVLRRALVEVLMHGDRRGLVERLDDSLLGLSPRPLSYLAVRAVAR